MKKVVKLDQKSLRGLIKEAIQGRQPGSPLFTPPPEKKRRSLSEAVAEGQELQTLLSSVADQWTSLSDMDDPSIQAVGPEAWDQQVEDAVSDLEQRIIEACDEVEQKLIDGEYYFEDPGYPGGHK